MFQIADVKQLRAARDPLPSKGPFVIYRGVAGRGRARCIRGLSWTASLKCAAWFASRFSGLPDPAVYRVTVNEASVLAYLNCRNEQEFIVVLPHNYNAVRVCDGEQLKQLAKECSDKRRQRIETAVQGA